MSLEMPLIPANDDERGIISQANDIKQQSCFLKIAVVFLFVLLILLLVIVCLLIVMLTNSPIASSHHITSDEAMSNNMINVSDNLEAICKEESCQYNVIDLKLDENNPLKILVVPNEILPGAQFLSYSFNLLRGMDASDLILEGEYKQIIDFTFEKGQISAGTENYLVPDQFDLPSIAGVCETEQSTSSVSSSISTSSMSSESMESTGESNFESSAKAGGWGVHMDASYGSASSHSNSRSMTKSQDAATKGRTSSSYTYSKALLYSTKLLWSNITSFKPEFMEAIRILNETDLENKIRVNIDTMLFVAKYGTHVLDLAKMGARCRETTYFSSSTSTEAQSAASETSASSSSSYSESSSERIREPGVAHESVSEAYSQSSSNSASGSYESSLDSSYTSQTSSKTIDCVGEVDVTTRCGSMLGTQNQPSLVGYRMKQIWSLPIFLEYNIARQVLIDGVININKAAEECGITNCGGLGVCGINNLFWDWFKYQIDDFPSNFSLLWDTNKCLDQYQFGTSLMKSGYGISTQMNQCNSTDTIKWGIRVQSSVVHYDPFCSGNMQIVAGLNLINRSISFQSEINYIQQNLFKLTYFLFSNNDYECTSIGGVSYAMFCPDTNVRIATKYILSFGNGKSMNVSTASPLYCSTETPPQAVGMISGYKYLQNNYDKSSTISIGKIIPVNDTTISVQYSAIMSFFDLSLIYFCYDSDFMRYGTITFIIEQEIPKKGPSGDSITYDPTPPPTNAPTLYIGEQTKAIPETSPSYLERRYVNFQETLHCLSVNVFVAFSGFTSGNVCSMGIWTESVNNGGFNLVLGIWNARAKWIKYKNNVNDRSCVTAGSAINATYFAVCQKF